MCWPRPRRPCGDAGEFVDVPVDEVAVGDLVLIRPGGASRSTALSSPASRPVDRAPVTGESWPADKGPGQPVFAGTINGTGALEIEAQRPASDSTSRGSSISSSTPR